MASTHDTLAQIDGQLAESMGVRPSRGPVRLSPMPRPQNIGRRPTSGFGRIAVDQVVPDAQQPRTEFLEEVIDRLAASIREQGQLTPIRVRWSADLGKWLIIAGERRWRATKRAGLPTIECYFHEQELSRSHVLEQQLIENLLREDLKPVEEARAFTELMKINNWTGKQVAAALCIPASKVSRSLALLKLPDVVQHQVDEGQISARTAYELSRLPDDSERTALVQDAATGELTHTSVCATGAGLCESTNSSSVVENCVQPKSACALRTAAPKRAGQIAVVVDLTARATVGFQETRKSMCLHGLRCSKESNRSARIRSFFDAPTCPTGASYASVRLASN